MRIQIPPLLGPLAFLLINGVLAYYCWVLIQRARRKLQTPDITQSERERAWFGQIIMWLPLLGFSFEFFYFLYKTLETIASMIAHKV